MHSVVEGGANLYDGNPAAGSPRGSQRVEMETFVYLRDNNLITRVDQPDQLRGPGQRQYRINEAGKAALSAARNCSR